jgi:hypothetical protein
MHCTHNNDDIIIKGMNQIAEQFQVQYLGELPRERMRIRKDFRAFVKWDRAHKPLIMAEVNAAMETWFASGVKFRRDPMLGDGLPPDAMQHAMPRIVGNLLETAFGRIAINVLEWEGVREDLIGQVMMAAPAFPLGVVAPFGVTHELNADFGVHRQLLPWAPVYTTRQMQPKQRAEVVGSRWYYLQASRVYIFVAEQWAKIQAQQRGESSHRIEKFLDLQRTLRALNFDLADRVQYYECKLRELKDPEISELLANLGKRRKSAAVKKSYQRQRKLVQLRQQNL